MGKIVIGNNQNILLTNGHVIKSKDLKEGDTLFSFNYDNETYIETNVLQVNKSEKPISLFSTSNGRLITCAIDTIFSGSLRKGLRSITTFNNKFDNYSWQNYVQCAKYKHVFGKEKITDEKASLIRSSIIYLNSKRPNDKESLVQTIPKMLSKLTRSSLKKVLNDINLIRNLDLYSKDLLIILLNRLGWGYKGNPHGRQSEEVSGTLNIEKPKCSTCTPRLQEEKLTCLGESNDDAIEVEFDNNVVIIGSLICRTI